MQFPHSFFISSPIFFGSLIIIVSTFVLDCGNAPIASLEMSKSNFNFKKKQVFFVGACAQLTTFTNYTPQQILGGYFPSKQVAVKSKALLTVKKKM
jgi:hypothetical protein